VDVHSPHRPIHTWKDFLLHLLVVTIGLFIALMLEAVVEALHHRHIVREARENLRREIESNRGLYAQDVRRVQQNRARLAADIEQLRNLRGGATVDRHALSWEWGWYGFSDASWNSARDTGAVLYMDSRAVERYSAIYAQQRYVNDTAVAIILDESRAQAPLLIAEDPARLTPAEIEAMLIDTARLHERLGALQSFMKGLDKGYAEEVERR